MNLIMANEKIVYQGPGLFTLLGITFLILKLCNVITWPWIWVLAPFWIPVAIILTILIIIGLFLGIITVFNIIID